MYNETLYGLPYSIPDGELIDQYRKTMRSLLVRLCPKLELSEIEEGMNYAISSHYEQARKEYDLEVKVHNNHSKKISKLGILELSNAILKKKPILTTQGVMFMRHGTLKNPFYQLVQYLLDKRDEAKTEMKKHPKGSEEYNKWNLKQLNYKVSCNAVYGCAGQFSSVFYNLFVCTAVTGQGRGCISASITMFEGLLANNMKFGSLTEVLQFIDHVHWDQKKPKMRKFEDHQVLDHDISVEDCYLKIIRNCGWGNWVPSDEACNIIWDTICNLDQRTINVLYYKNNLYEFCNNSRIMNLIMKILTKLEKPFLNPDKKKIPPEIKDELNMLTDLIYEYCYYRHLWFDKLQRVYTMSRDVVLITDTDSCIICLDEWYQFILPRTIGVPMNIKYTQAEIKAAAEKIELEWRKTEPIQDYDFYRNELVDAKRKEYPLVIIEEDGLRYSIVNIMSYVVSQLILDYMILFSENYNTETEGRECLLIMKNEFLFKSLLLTYGAKNYADIQLVQEGNLIPESQQLDIKGMPISKVNIPESTATALKEILEYDILRTSFVDQIDIFRKLVVLEKKIYKSIADKSKEYHKPARIKSLSNYKDPMRIQGIKASFAYNKLKSEEEPSIDLEERNTVLIIKVDASKKTIYKIEKEFPDYYQRFQDLLEVKEYKSGIEAIAIPENSEIPSWIIPLIDYTTIIHDNLRNFPMDEIGMSKNESKDVTHTNILKL